MRIGKSVVQTSLGLLILCCLVHHVLGFSRRGQSRFLSTNSARHGLKLHLRMSAEEVYKFGEDGIEDKDVEVLSRTVEDQLTPIVENMIVDMAINTAGFYMSEFRDSTSKAWMMQYLGYNNNGFPENDWKKYIESMIHMDPTEFLVVSDPPSNMRRGRSWSQAMDKSSSFKIQYKHKIEPRKIANQIVQVTENVGKELVLDLHCIKNENKEAARFASTWVQEGLESALKSRKLTRYVADSSTPMRDRNYHDLNILVTNLALDMTRADLKSTDDKNNLATLVYLDEYVYEVIKTIDSLKPLDVLQDARGPRCLIEKLYYKGLTENIIECDNCTVNVLKLANKVLDKRMATATCAMRIVNGMQHRTRHYYAMIKNCGGFKRFDMRDNEVEWTVVDVDEKGLALLDGKKLQIDKLNIMTSISKSDKNMNTKTGDITESEPLDEAMVSKPKAEVSDGTSNNVNPFGNVEDFGSIDPIMM